MCRRIARMIVTLCQLKFGADPGPDATGARRSGLTDGCVHATEVDG
jgi:hypothetical protein